MGQETSSKTVDVLIGSPRQEFWDELQTVLQGFYPYKMRWVKSIDEIMDAGDAQFQPILALIDGLDGTSVASEWAQATRMTYEKCPIIVLHTAKSEIDFEALKKNGASEIMHMNYDKEFISDMVLQLAPIQMDSDQVPIAALMPVDTRDMESESEINFDIFVHLPNNKKTVLYRKTGTKIESKSLDKFASQKQNMYIKKTQMKSFFEYARTVQSSRDVANPVSLTEKFQKSKKAIFTIMSNFMNSVSSDFQEGRRILAECSTIIESFELTKKRSDSEIYTEICRFAGNVRTNYHDSICVASYAALFAQLLQLPEDSVRNAALAGLLHNIGMIQTDQFEHYPERSVIMVKNKKVSLPQAVSLAIEQHREQANGKGFPKGLKNEDLEPLSKVLIMAYHFHLMTALEKQQPSFTPHAAFAKINDEAMSGDGRFDLILANQLYKKIKNF